MKRRMFIAIPIPQEIKLKIKNLQACFQKEISHGVRWVSPESIHVTLKFLGSLDDSLIENIAKCMEDIAQLYQDFHFSVTSLGVFPSFKKPKIIWAGIQGAEQILEKLNQDLEQAMLPFGIKSENKKFLPHLTLGRVQKNFSSTDLEALFHKYSNTDFGQTKVNSINLYQSNLMAAGAVYTILCQVKLNNR